MLLPHGRDHAAYASVRSTMSRRSADRFSAIGDRKQRLAALACRPGSSERHERSAVASLAATCGLRFSTSQHRLREERGSRRRRRDGSRSGWRWRTCRSASARGSDWPSRRPGWPVSARTVSTVCGARHAGLDLEPFVHDQRIGRIRRLEVGQRLARLVANRDGDAPARSAPRRGRSCWSRTAKCRAARSAPPGSSAR